MNRILNLEKQFIAETERLEFSKLRSSSTIDPIETIKFAYGPNYQWRLKTLDIIKNNPEVF